MTTEAMRLVSVKVNVASGTPAANLYDFVSLATAGERRVASSISGGATGVVPVGVLMEAPDTASDGDKDVAMAIMDGAISEVKLAEAVATIGADLRTAGSGETAGRAYLANATGDIICAKALRTGAVGDVIPVMLVGYAGAVA